MSKEKQIEEMANEIMTVVMRNRNMLGVAETLYNIGYRKQSEGEWKKRGNEKTCSLCKFIYYSNNDEWSYYPNCGAKMKQNQN